MSSRTCFGISKVANLLKSLDSESILKQVQHRIQNDKIGIFLYYDTVSLIVRPVLTPKKIIGIDTIYFHQTK